MAVSILVNTQNYHVLSNEFTKMLIKQNNHDEKLTTSFFYNIATHITKQMMKEDFSISFYHNIFDFYKLSKSRKILEDFLAYLLYGYNLNECSFDLIKNISLSKDFEFLPFIFFVL